MKGFSFFASFFHFVCQWNCLLKRSIIPSALCVDTKALKNNWNKLFPLFKSKIWLGVFERAARKFEDDVVNLLFCNFLTQILTFERIEFWLFINWNALILIVYHLEKRAKRKTDVKQQFNYWKFRWFVCISVSLYSNLFKMRIKLVFINKTVENRFFALLWYNITINVLYSIFKIDVSFVKPKYFFSRKINHLELTSFPFSDNKLNNRQNLHFSPSP